MKFLGHLQYVLFVDLGFLGKMLLGVKHFPLLRHGHVLPKIEVVSLFELF